MNNGALDSTQSAKEIITEKVLLSSVPYVADRNITFKPVKLSD